MNRAFNQPFIHYGEGLGGETEWMREFNMAYGTFLNVGVSGTLVVAFASPLVAELLISGGSAGALTTEAIATRVGIEVISQTAVNMATFGIEGISRLDVADVAISASGLNYVAGSTFGATVDWEPFNNNKLTGWGFGKNSGDVVTDFSVGLFAGGQSNALNSLNANKTLIKVFDLWNTTKANGLGAVVQENTK